MEYRHELQLAREEERKEAAERALQEHREREKRLEVVKQQASSQYIRCFECLLVDPTSGESLVS